MACPGTIAALSFDETDRPITTPSNVQVRQPALPQLGGARRRYEAYLEPLLVELESCRRPEATAWRFAGAAPNNQVRARAKMAPRPERPAENRSSRSSPGCPANYAAGRSTWEAAVSEDRGLDCLRRRATFFSNSWFRDTMIHSADQPPCLRVASQDPNGIEPEMLGQPETTGANSRFRFETCTARAPCGARCGR